MTTQQLTIAVIGAGGKWACGCQATCSTATTRSSTARTHRPVSSAPLTPDGPLPTLRPPSPRLTWSSWPCPTLRSHRCRARSCRSLKSGTIVLTLDPAAAYANLLYQRDDVEYAVAHPCHPSVFLQRKTEAELNDTFGGIAAAQDVVAALESGNEEKIRIAEEVIRLMYAPVVDVHWVTVKQLAYLEPTLVEVVACMVGDLLNDALQETVHTVGVPEPAAGPCCSATSRWPWPTVCEATTRSLMPA